MMLILLFALNLGAGLLNLYAKGPRWIAILCAANLGIAALICWGTQQDPLFALYLYEHGLWM